MKNFVNRLTTSILHSLFVWLVWLPVVCALALIAVVMGVKEETYVQWGLYSAAITAVINILVVIKDMTS